VFLVLALVDASSQKGNGSRAVWQMKPVLSAAAARAGAFSIIPYAQVVLERSCHNPWSLNSAQSTWSSADAARFDASAFLRLAVVVSLPQIYGRLRNNSEKKAC